MGGFFVDVLFVCSFQGFQIERFIHKSNPRCGCVFFFTLSFTNVTEAVDSSGDTDFVQISNSEFRKLPQCRVAWHRKVRRDEGVDLQATRSSKRCGI